jgi:hypothetical protein
MGAACKGSKKRAAVTIQESDEGQKRLKVSNEAKAKAARKAVPSQQGKDWRHPRTPVAPDVLTDSDSDDELEHEVEGESSCSCARC